MTQHHFAYEIIAVDDGSRDNSWQVIQAEAKLNNNIKGIKFQRNYGKSPALNEGFKMAKGTVVITMDADLQDSPDEIPALYNLILAQNFDLVSGWKKKRFDNTLTKNIPSKFFNWATRRMSGIPLNDFNCGLKAYKNNVVKSIEIYGEMHRYIPVLAKWAGFNHIGEKVVTHQARKYGTTKFGWERFVNGFLDLITINFVSRFGKRPMHFFGLLGALSFFLGFCISLYLAYTKFVWHEYAMTARPIFYLALVLMIIGTQFFLAGFLGELISRSASDRNYYLVEQKINFE
jgi:glycosyltransferase involved in cell wall biosynthesis